MLLKEKLILEEPEDENALPDAIPAEPIVVSTEVGETSDAKVPEEIETNAYSSLLMDEISKQYESINRANSLIATFAEGDGYADVLEILNDIVDKRTLVVGELHTALSIVDPETGGLIYDGMGDLKQDDAFDGPLDESASITEKVTRSDRRIAKFVNKHLTEKDAKNRFKLFVYEVNPKTFAKMKDTEQDMGDFDTKKEAEEQGEATVKSWNVNNAGVKYGYVVRGVID